MLRWGQKPWVWSGITLIVLSLGLGAAGRYFAANQLREQRALVSEQLELQQRAVNRAFGRILGSLAAMTRFAVTEGGAAPEDFRRKFETFASGLNANLPWVRSFQIVSDGVITHVYPQAGNEAAVGYNLYDDPRPFISGDVRRALKTGLPTVSGPVKLVQGELGVIIRMPIGQLPGGPERLVAVVVNVAELLTETGVVDPVRAPHLRFALRDNREVVFYGPAEVFAAHPVAISVELPEGVWEIAAVPVGGWTAAVRSAMVWFYAVGAAFVGLLSLLVHSVAQRQLDLAQAVAARTAELHRQHRLVHAVIEGTTDAVFVKDRHGCYEMINTPGARILGKAPADIVGRTDAELLPAETARSFQAHDQQVLANGVTSMQEEAGEIAGVRRVFLASKSPWLDDRGRVLGVIGISRDITARHEEEAQREKLLHTTEQARHALLGVLEDQRRTEAELRASEVRYRSLFEQAAVGVAQVAPDGRWLQVNQRLCDMVGYTQEELVTGSFQQITHPDDLEADLDLVRRVLADEIKNYTLEKRYLRKDGAIVWANLSVALLRDEAGRPQYFISVVQDIQLRKAAEAALQESVQQFQFVTDHAPVLIAHCDREQRYRFVNRSYAELFGQQPGALVGRTVREVLGAEAYALARPHIAVVLAGRATEYDLQLPVAPERPRSVHVTYAPERDVAGQVVGFLAAVTDITARVEAETRLRETEELFRRAITGAGAVPYEYDYAARKYSFLGPEIEALTGYPAAEFSGPFWQQIIEETIQLGETVGLSKAEATRRIKAGELSQWRADVRIRTRAGAERWLSDVSVQKSDATGRVVGSIGILQDITERKQAEQKLHASREQLRALLARLHQAQEEERMRVAREIHDELGQLLTGLKMDVRWLERKLAGPEVPASLHPLLDRAVAASALADQTIAVVQEIAAELRPGVLDRLGLAAALTQRVRRFQERSGIHCRVRVTELGPALPPELATDLYYICQEALTNVARHAHATEVDICFESTRAGILLEIADNGNGIVAAQCTAIESLGLLGMRERAAHHGGTVSWESGDPQGTRVTVQIPAAKSDSTPGASA